MQGDTLNNYSANAKAEVLMNPVKSPRQIVLEGQIAAGRNNMFFDDACAISSALSLVGQQTGTEFSVQGQITNQNVKDFLKSFALIVSAYNYNSSVASDLSNNLSIITPNLDTTSATDIIFSSATVSNMQYNADLLNVKSGFVWSNITALKLSGTPGTIYTLTLLIQRAVPYGQLDDYLIANPIYKNLSN